MKTKLSPEETRKIVAIYFASSNSPTKTARQFNHWAAENHVQTRVSKKNVIDVLKRFHSGGITLNGAGQRVYKKTTDEDILTGVISSLYQIPGGSIRNCAEDMDISVGTTHTIARSVLKLYPYRLLLVQQLSEYDKLVRFEACHRLQNIITDDKIIVFTDECTFYTDGHINRWDCVQWDYVRPSDFHVESTQGAKAVTVWGGMSQNRVFGPYFFPSTVTGDSYRAILAEFFLPEAHQAFGSLENIWFQQDGAPAHVAQETKWFLANTFDDRIISRDFQSEWPPRSPDLTPCDFHLWGEVKELAYHERIANNSVPELQEKIIRAFHKIRQERMTGVRNAVLAVKKRLEKCITLCGNQLEHC